MDGNNQNNMDNYIPKEIPIPGGEEQNGKSLQENQRNMNAWQSQDNLYGQSNNPYHHNPYQTEESVEGGAKQAYNPQGNRNESMSQPYNGQANVNGWTGQPYPPQGNKKGTSTKIILGVACAFVVILAIGLGVAGYLRSRPGYKIAKGIQNLSQEMNQNKNPLLEKIGYDDILLMMRKDGSYVKSSLDFSMDIPMLGTTTIGIDTDCYKDMQAKEMNADTSISMMNYDFAHLSIYADEDVFCFSMPELFMEDMYIDNENVISQFNRSILADGGEIEDIEDFSIDLFPELEGDAATVIDVWRNLDGIYEGFSDDLKACKDGMKIEKAEKGLYRVILPAKETNRLIQNVAENYSDVYGMQEDMELLTEYDEVFSDDLSLLFEINGRNRIESILLENPVSVLDRSGMMEAELFFLGEERSIDKIQGKISASAGGVATREIIFQIEQTVSGHISQMAMDMKMNEDEDTVGRMKLETECNAAQDYFGMTFAFRDDEDDLEIDIEGNIDDYVKGQSVKADLSKMTFMMDGEDMFRITGDITIQPLRSEVERTVQAETAFFKMTWDDWFDIVEQLDDAYGSVLDYLW